MRHFVRWAGIVVVLFFGYHWGSEFYQAGIEIGGTEAAVYNGCMLGFGFVLLLGLVALIYRITTQEFSHIARWKRTGSSLVRFISR